ncbi:MAG TPA: DUF1127 domain-containing protein [Beijerinckiaceae bacterium]|jgi:uncharacterized protein YjiS (DUF1127 family)
MFLVTIFASLTRWARYRADTQRLLQFSDSELSDIGLSRGDVEAAVHGRLRSPA